MWKQEISVQNINILLVNYFFNSVAFCGRNLTAVTLSINC